ncbi:hypothetical protein E2320_007345 [Naja naja]|nr:hypothetical protein E2320_007345 [Naja naja]
MGPKPVKSQVSIMAPGGEKRTQMNPFSQVSPTVLWIFLATLATICLVVLMMVSYLYAALVNKPLHPLEESMKKLGVTIAVGLRSPKIKHEDHSLFRKSRKSGTEWQSFGNGLYYVSQGKKTWYEAENFCMSREAHLTSILSSEEQNYVTSQLTQPAWIGLTDGGQGKWEWTDGSRLGQPGHSERLGDGDQDCTIIVPSSKGQNWNDVDCNQLNRWVCKGTLGTEENKIHQTH